MDPILNRAAARRQSAAVAQAVIPSSPDEPEYLLKIGQVARRLNVSLTTVKKLNATAKLPEPVRLGRALRWQAADIERWVELGTPKRDRFEALKKR